jgi:hypothetical protein
LILARFYSVPTERVGLYLFVLAIGNFCGPLLLGSLFDTVERKKMIAETLRDQWHPVTHHGLHVRRRVAFGRWANGRVVRYLLFCIGSRKFCLPHSKRNISPRSPFTLADAWCACTA